MNWSIGEFVVSFFDRHAQVISLKIEKCLNSNKNKVVTPKVGALLANFFFFEILRFISPNCVSRLFFAVNTLVGMRGLLLSMKGLREQVVEPNYSQSGGTGHILETNFNDPIFFGVRRQKNSSNDNANTPSNPVNNDGTLSHSEADARLRDRFLSLFFWPALMATIKPDERRYLYFVL